MSLARILLAAAFLLAILPRLAAEDSLDTLRREQRELAATLHEKRTELIAKDEALRDLHRKIMALHKELAIRLDNHRELRDLVRQMRDLEAKIRRQEGRTTTAPDQGDEKGAAMESPELDDKGAEK